MERRNGWILNVAFSKIERYFSKGGRCWNFDFFFFFFLEKKEEVCALLRFKRWLEEEEVSLEKGLLRGGRRVEGQAFKLF